MTDEEETQGTPNLPLVALDKESVKLVKNSKGHTWEIKIVADVMTETELKRLEALNDWMNAKYSRELE